MKIKMYVTSSKKRVLTKLRKLYDTEIIGDVTYDGKNYIIETIKPKQFYKACVALQCEEWAYLKILEEKLWITPKDNKDIDKDEQIDAIK